MGEAPGQELYEKWGRGMGVKMRFGGDVIFK